jgi:glucose dehydrogenase
MRKFLFVVTATALLAAAIVALASASSTASGKKSATNPEGAGYLPAGVAPCGTDWPNYACDSSGTAYSTLTQLTPSNVGKLKMVWQDSLEGPNFTTWPAQNQPIVVSGAGKNLPLDSGTMFIATNTGMKALDPTNGNILWTYQGPLIDPVTRVAGRSFVRTTRDEAYGKGMVFVGQQDRSIVALNAKTGAPIWTAQMGSYGTFGEVSRQSSTATTTFYDDGKDGLVITATNGGEAPLRGFVDAYNAKTGKLVWRFYTTPDPTELPYILTWGNPANAAFGGAAMWSIPVVDPELKTVYFGTGNAYPYYGRAPGKNLWSVSLVAVNAATGALKWYHQGVHHDEWDYDCPTPPVLFNTTQAGKSVHGVAYSCKSAYIYVLDRKNGRTLPMFPIPEVKVPDLNNGKGAALNNTWPTQPEPTGGAAQILPHCPTEAQAKDAFPSYPVAPNGKPMILTCPYAGTTDEAYLVWGPAYGNGGTDYPRMAYNPKTNDLYVCANGTLIGVINRSPTDYNQTVISGTMAHMSGTVTALNMGTNKVDWQVSYTAAKDGPCYSGVATTAGGLVFVASKGRNDISVSTAQAQNVPYGGYIYAYDAKTGKELWSWQAADNIWAPPITYMVKGKQYVAEYTMGPVSSGKIDRLTAFSL